MIIELGRRGREVATQRSFPVFYHGQLIGSLVPDLIIDGAIVVETKVVSSFNDAHVAQTIGYLSISGLELGILFNFKSSRLEWKRVVRSQQKPAIIPDLHA